MSISHEGDPVLTHLAEVLDGRPLFLLDGTEAPTHDVGTEEPIDLGTADDEVVAMEHDYYGIASAGTLGAVEQVVSRQADGERGRSMAGRILDHLLSHS